MQSYANAINWPNVHAAFRRSGLSFSAFHRSRLPAFCKGGGRVPSLGTFSCYMQRLDLADAAERSAGSARRDEAMPSPTGREGDAPRPIVRKIGHNHQLVELTAEQFAACARPGNAKARPPAPCRRVCIRLNSGVSLEFESSSPEQFAADIIRAAGGLP